MEKLEKKSDPLPTATKFCFYFELRPAVGFYLAFEYIVWILLLLSAVNFEIETIEKTNLVEFQEVLRKDLYYNIIFGQPETIVSANTRCKILFLVLTNFFNFFLYFQHQQFSSTRSLW